MNTFFCRFLADLTAAVVKAMRNRHSSSLIVLSLVLVAFQFSVREAAAQTTTSTIEGIVTDANGAVVPGATVKASGDTLATERRATTDANGFYRLSALPAGTYSVTVSGTGFAEKILNIELTLNRNAVFDVQLQVGAVGGEVVVTDVLPLLESTASSTGATVTTKQILDLPVNGREYLDLLQLVPGVAINRQSSGDNANPVLGERSGNNNFFIDGQPNKDTVNGGPAAQFNQETIAEFQVLTNGYKAEFGQASGAIINVITKSGGNAFHGVGSLFLRNDALDSSNALDPYPPSSSAPAATETPLLRRYDYSLALGGPIWKDRIFFFGSSERISEDRGSNFLFPTLGTSAGAATILQLLHAQEDPLDGPQKSREIRNFFKLNEQFGRHQLVQEMNYTNEYVRGSGATLPTARTSSSGRKLLLAFGDTMLLGDQGNPWIVTLRAAFRGEPSETQPAHPGYTSTILNTFTSQQPCPPACGFFGDLPSVQFGSPSTPSNLHQKYTAFSASANRVFGDHDLKFGWQYLRTKVDGIDGQILQNQLFTTVADYITFGPINSGPFLLLEAGGATPADSEIHLLNNFNALYVQDDWKLRKNLTLNLGIRWDHDSEFDAQKNFSPRLGVAWAVTPKTVIRASFGKFYDQFRLGLVGNVPAFGGSNRQVVQPIYFPRGFYGSPTIHTSIAFFSGLPGPCVSNTLTDAQIAAAGTTCAVGGPIVGVDRLNRVVAPGHALIPANAVINISNIQALSGLTPAQFLTQAAAAIGQPNGYFAWGQHGVLNNPVIPSRLSPSAVQTTFKTPHTLSFSVGVQREISKDMVVEVDYFHREMNNLLGVRLSNLAFRSRVTGRAFDPPNTGGEIITFGPFFEGKYDGLVASFNKRLSNRYQIGASYTYAKATDNSRGIGVTPSDNFIGIAPQVTDPGRAAVAATPTAPAIPACPSQNNHTSSFIACRGAIYNQQTARFEGGNFVAQAGTFVNGPDLDKGPSDLALDHLFQVNGLVELPWQFQIGGIFRVQSGFHFSRFDEASRDPDGNTNFNGVDVAAGRNAFTGPSFANVDVRVSKRFNFSERVKLEVLFEFFNLLNYKNPAAIQNRADSPLRPTLRPFATATQVLPGREGQVGFRLSF